MTESKLKIGSPTMLLALGLICACTISTLAVLRPRPVEPRQISQLWVDADRVRAVLAADADAAGAFDQEGNEEIIQLAQRAGSGESTNSAQRDLVDLRARAAALPEPTLSGLRSQAAIDLSSALANELSPEHRHLVLGDFRNSLRDYGLVGGEQNAPMIVARTLFKARWNILHGFPAEAGFASVEQELYWGWLALKTDVAPARRLLALTELGAHSSQDTRDVRAHLFYQAEQFVAAASVYEEAYNATGSVRERNHALYVAERATQ